MTSVMRYARQVPLSTTYYSAATAVYQFIPASSNVVGNYPPGYMQTVTIASSTVARDMGKTIYAGIGATPTAYGWFREMQALVPASISASQGFIGGTSGQTFGVIGDATTPNGNMDYFTFYVPVVIGGVAAAGPSVQTPVAGGQL